MRGVYMALWIHPIRLFPLRPVLYCLKTVSYTHLDVYKRQDMESRRSLDAFIAAMPDTRISFARALAPKSEKHFRLCADEAACAAWALPLEHTAGLPSARCVRVIHRFACQPWDDEAVPEILACAQKAGHAVRVDGELFGLHLASETSEGKVSLYAAVYLPI